MLLSRLFKQFLKQGNSAANQSDPGSSAQGQISSVFDNKDARQVVQVCLFVCKVLIVTLVIGGTDNSIENLARWKFIFEKLKL